MIFQIECKDDKASNLLNVLKSEGLTGKKSDNFKFVTDDGVLYLVYDGDDCKDSYINLELQTDHEPTPRDFAVLRKKIRIFAKKCECKIKSMSLESPDKKAGDDHYLYCYPLPKSHPIIPKDDEEKAKTMKNLFFYRLLQNGKEYQAALDKAEELDAAKKQENDRESEDEESEFVVGWFESIQDEMFQAADYDWSSGEKLTVIVPIQITIFDGDGKEVDSRPFPCQVKPLPSSSQDDDDEEIDDEEIDDEEIDDEEEYYDLSELAQFPRSAELHQLGGNSSKMVCSCGSSKFKFKICVVGGYNKNGFKRIEKFQFGYVCQKCGAEVYLGMASDEEAYFYFVPKNKLAVARSIVAKHEIPFGKDFFISTRWDDILCFVDYSQIYHYLKIVLDDPTNIMIEYSNDLVVDNAGVRKIVTDLADDLFSILWDFDDPDDHSDPTVKPLSKVAVKPNQSYSVGFGPCTTFVLDENGELQLNDDAKFVPDEQPFPYEGSPYESFYDAMKIFREISDGKKIVFLPEGDEGIMMDDAAKFIDSISEADDFKYYALAVINTGSLGDKIVIYQNRIQIVHRTLTGMFGIGKDKDNSSVIFYKNIIYKPASVQGKFPPSLAFSSEDGMTPRITFDYKTKGNNTNVLSEELAVRLDYKCVCKLTNALNKLLCSFWQTRNLLNEQTK